MLSGGLDTSSIVSTISSQLNDNNIQPIDFKTYSITFKQLKKIDFDKAYETNYIKDVIQKYKINSSIINLILLMFNQSCQKFKLITLNQIIMEINTWILR